MWPGVAVGHLVSTSRTQLPDELQGAERESRRVVGRESGRVDGSEVGQFYGCGLLDRDTLLPSRESRP